MGTFALAAVHVLHVVRMLVTIPLLLLRAYHAARYNVASCLHVIFLGFYSIRGSFGLNCGKRNERIIFETVPLGLNISTI